MTATKPMRLKLLDGTHRTTRDGRREVVEAAARKSAEVFGRLERPDHIEGPALDLWEKCIAPAWWLDGSRLVLAVGLCDLWNEYRSSPKDFPQWKHAQMRSYLRDLGLTDERNRIIGAPEEKENSRFA